MTSRRRAMFLTIGAVTCLLLALVALGYSRAQTGTGQYLRGGVGGGRFPTAAASTHPCPDCSVTAFKRIF